MAGAEGLVPERAAIGMAAIYRELGKKSWSYKC
jgi:hypothetical protein